MSSEISVKNTKNEILEAYHEALEKLQSIKRVSKQQVKVTEEKKETVAKAISHSTDDIVKNIATLKLSLVRSLEDIEEQLLSSHKQLTTLQEAIEIQSKELSDLHEIKLNADSLAALLHAQKEKTLAFDMDIKERTRAFEQDMEQKRAKWKKEQDEFELLRKESEQEAKKSRQREEDEYIYQRDLIRQKEQDQHNLKKEVLEKELAAKRMELEQEFSSREASIVVQEQELQALQQKVEQFPHELQKSIEDTTKAVTERLTFKFDYETKLSKKEAEGERKLFQQMISALEAKVIQLESQAKNLTDKSNQANLQVQDIAVKAIESSSLRRFMPSYDEKPVEQLKQ